MTTEKAQPSGTHSRPRFVPAIRLEHLWVLVVLGTFGVFISLSPTDPEDFWWHLKAGELIATGSLPAANVFAWSLPASTPFIYQSWLGEWLLFLLYQGGGLPLIIFARNMLGLGAFALVALEGQQRSASWRLAAVGLLLAVLMSMNNLNARTQNWSWIPFALTLLLAGGYVRQRLSARWLIALPLLMVFWVNAHGAFMMGLLVMGAYVVGETLRRMLRQPHALNWDQLKPLYAAAAGMLVATVVNPLGFGVFGYVLKLLTDAPSQNLGMEWQSPTTETLAGMFFFLGVLALLAALGLGRRRPTITDMLLVCGLGWMAFSGVRYVVWFAMAAMPILAQSLAAPRPVFKPGGSSETPRPPRHRRPGKPLPNLVVALLLVLLVALVQPWFKPLLSLPQPYQELFAPVPDAPLLFSANTPVEATEHLRASPCQGNLFNEMGYGSYLIWALYPQQQVFIDPRVELYPLEMWQDYLSLSRGYDVEALLTQYGITCVMLDLEDQPRLSEAMERLPDWQRTFGNEQSEVWRQVSNA